MTAAEMLPIISSLVIAAIGGMAVKIIDVIVAGNRERRASKKSSADHVSLLESSRLMWRDYAYRLRSIMHRLMDSDDIPEPPADPLDER